MNDKLSTVFPQTHWLGERYAIKQIGCSVLRLVAEAFDCEFLSSNKTDIQELAERMAVTMKKCGGVGLAGPQIGLSKRIFVIASQTPENSTVAKTETNETTSSETIKYKSNVMVFINPEILETSEETCTMHEGCLSVPMAGEDVVRPCRVKVRYLDMQLCEHIETFTGLDARIIQHEYDHLEGHLYIDRLPLLRRQLIAKKLKG